MRRPEPIRRSISLLPLVLLISAWAPSAALGQCPDLGTLLFPGEEGVTLQSSLRVAYRPPVGLSYAAARDVMFSQIDNVEGTVFGVYTNFAVPVDPQSPAPRTVAFNQGMNTEHTWPQSKGAGSLPARADLHHLFPSEILANNDRGAHPFDEIPDELTDLWYRLAQRTTSPDPVLIDTYSEYDQTHPSPAYTGRWEAREIKKGDVARAMFYFWTVYRAEALSADASYFGVQKNVLRDWHLADPVSDEEYERTCAIAPYQDDKPNPFVIDPTLVDRAYFDGVPVRLVHFTADLIPGGVRLTWDTTSETAHSGFHVVREGAGRTDRITPALVRPGDPYEITDTMGEAGRTYAYWLEATARDGSRQRFGPRHVRFPEPAIRVGARPNPARAGEPVRVTVSGGVPTRAALYDVSGRAVRRWRAPASPVLRWDGRLDSGRPAPAGLYLLAVEIDGRSLTTRLILLP